MPLRVFGKIFLFAFAFLLFYSCLECETCGPSPTGPVFTARFFNIDSLTQLEEEIVILDSLIDETDSIADLFQDSLDIVDELLDQPDSLIMNEDSLENLQDNFQSIIEALQAQEDSLAALRTEFSDTQGTINSGLIRVDTIQAIGTNNSLLIRDTIFQGVNFSVVDSFTSFQIPVDLEFEESTYIIIIGNRRDTLSVSYNLEQFVGVQDIMFQAIDFDTTSHTYDSILINTSGQRLSNETTLDCFF